MIRVTTADIRLAKRMGIHLESDEDQRRQMMLQIDLLQCEVDSGRLELSEVRGHLEKWKQVAWFACAGLGIALGLLVRGAR